jgi:hypothetical protein
MAEGDYEQTSKADELLNRLIRTSRGSRPAHSVRPDDEAITAYVLGTATPEQVECVQAALAQSGDFRREVLQMIEDVEALSVSGAVDTHARVPAAPRYRDFLKRYGKPAPEAMSRRWGWAWLRRFASVRVYAPAAVATAVIVGLLVLRSVTLGPGLPTGPQFARLNMVTEHVENWELRSVGELRSTTEESQEAYSDARSAAVAVMRNYLLIGDSTSLALSTWKPAVGTAEEGTSIVLRMTDESGTTLGDFAGAVPSKRGRLAAPDAFFILALPSQTLRSGTLEADTTVVRWQMAWGTKGCVAYAFPCDHRFCAIPVSTFDLRGAVQSGDTTAPGSPPQHSTD